MIKGIFIILAFLLLGEKCSHFMSDFIPGSVLGMMLLFVSLVTKLIKADDVRAAANFLTKNMALFFVPASIGIMSSWNLISQNILPLTLISVMTTVLVIAVVAFIQEQSEKRKSTK